MNHFPHPFFLEGLEKEVHHSYNFWMDDYFFLGGGHDDRENLCEGKITLKHDLNNWEITDNIKKSHLNHEIVNNFFVFVKLASRVKSSLVLLKF